MPNINNNIPERRPWAVAGQLNHEQGGERVHFPTSG